MSKDGMTSERWARIKQLTAPLGRYLHISSYPIYVDPYGKIAEFDDDTAGPKKYVGNSRGITYRKKKEETNVEA
jgi:hypothetical protein